MERLRSIPLTSGRHDRAAVRRRDEAWLRQVVRKGPLRIIAVRSQSELLVADGSRLASLETAHVGQDAELTFLGVDLEGAAIFVCDADACELAAELLEAHAFHELRAIGGALTPDDAALAVQAVALVGWHRRHRFCG